MTFLHPTLLLLAPLAAVGAWLLLRRGVVEADGGRFPRIHRLWADRGGLRAMPGAYAARGRGLLLGGAAALALLALARPQWGDVAEPRVTRSRDVMLALDLSRSMLADDVAPSRLARARLLVEALLDALRGERVGLTVFAGTAFVQSPLSADYEILRALLGGLEPSFLPRGGTDYAAMLRAAADAVTASGDGDRYLVVLSDGEAHDDAWQALLPTLRERGIRVIGLGVGTASGAPVPDERGGVLHDSAGAPVLSRLEPRTLQALAEQTGGTYRDAATWVDIADLVGATVAQGRAAGTVVAPQVRRQDRFQWFLAPALLLALLSFCFEFPILPFAGAFSTRRRRSHRASATAIATALGGCIAWHASPCPARAAATDAPPPPSVAAAHPAVDLAATVAELSARSTLTAPEYRRLATDTIGFVAQPQALRGAARGGVIDDALTAVDRGMRADAQAADWSALRSELERLRTVEDPPPPPQPQEKPQPQQSAQQPGDEKEDAADHGAGQDGAPEAQQQAKGGEAGGEQASASGQGDGAQSPPREPDAEAPQQAGDASPSPQPAAAQAAPASGREDGAADAAPMRMVGGGMPQDEPLHGADGTVLQARARQVAEDDAPAVLFDRMNRAEGRPGAAAGGKNW